MASVVSPIPEGLEGVVAYLSVDGAAAAIDFMKRAFGAVEVMRLTMPGDKIGHAELRIGGRPLMLADEFPDMEFLGPRAHNGTPVHLHLYVEDADATVASAAAAGALVIRAVADQFYGDRSGAVEDPFGHVWHVATRKENLTQLEIEERLKTMGS